MPSFIKPVRQAEDFRLVLPKPKPKLEVFLACLRILEVRGKPLRECAGSTRRDDVLNAGYLIDSGRHYG